jgi:hypothetical protein
LDSMAIINLCLMVEDKFAEGLSKIISLIDDSPFSEKILPIESIRNLKAYLTKVASLDDNWKSNCYFPL